MTLKEFHLLDLPVPLCYITIPIHQYIIVLKVFYLHLEHCYHQHLLLFHCICKMCHKLLFSSYGLYITLVGELLSMFHLDHQNKNLVSHHFDQCTSVDLYCCTIIVCCPIVTPSFQSYHLNHSAKEPRCSKSVATVHVITTFKQHQRTMFYQFVLVELVIPLGLLMHLCIHLGSSRCTSPPEPPFLYHLFQNHHFEISKHLHVQFQVPPPEFFTKLQL